LPYQRATQKIRSDDERRTEEQTSRQENRVGRADDEPHEVRDHEADESDDAGHGDGSAHDYGRREYQATPHPGYVHAERDRLDLAEEQSVQLARRRDDDRGADERGRRDEQHFVPSPGFEAAHEPAKGLASLFVLLERQGQDERRESARETPDGDAGQEQRSNG
jgi:hypothetical protein